MDNTHYAIDMNGTLFTWAEMYGPITMAVINILTGILFLCHAEMGQFAYVLPLMLIIAGSLIYFPMAPPAMEYNDSHKWVLCIQK